jgi:hypothetical protein
VLTALRSNYRRRYARVGAPKKVLRSGIPENLHSCDSAQLGANHPYASEMGDAPLGVVVLSRLDAST